MPDVIAAAPRADGITFRPGDFFEPWQVSADVIIMSRILRDWDDSKASKILKNAAKALLQGGKCLILEMILQESAPNGHLCDLHLLAVSGGRERTIRQWGDLLNANGFKITSVHSRDGFINVIEGEPYVYDQ